MNRLIAIVAAICVPVLCHVASAALIVVTADRAVDDTLTHANDDFLVVGLPGMPVTLTIAPKGVIRQASATADGNILMTASPEGFGGAIGSDVGLFGSTNSFTMHGGTVFGSIGTLGGGRASLRGGFVTGDVDLNEGSVSLAGGTVVGDISLSNDASAFVSSGSIGGDISAGFRSLLNFEGYTGTYAGELSSRSTGELKVYGQNLALNGTRLTGTLINGGTLDATVAPGSTLYLNSVLTPVPGVPEPAILSLLAAGGGLALRRGRR